MFARRLHRTVRGIDGTGVAAVAMLIATSASAQPARGTQAYGTVLVSSDSIDQLGATLSPDGRWIAFNGPALRAVANGKVIPLAPRGQGGSRPVWFPTSDQIAYRDESGIFRVAIDRATGAPQGMPKRVSLEPAAGGFDVSPDGGQMVYRTATASNDRAQLKIIPATGGNARVLVDSASDASFPRFSSDGRFVYYLAKGAVMRVPAGGGASVRVFGPDLGTRLFEPNRQLVLLQTNPRTATIVSLTRDTVAVVPLKDGIPPGWAAVMRFGPDGRSLIAYEMKEKTTLSLVSSGDLSPRAIGSGRDDYPLFWSPDGSRLFSIAPQDTTDALVTIDAKTGARVPLLAAAMPPKGNPGLHQFAISRDGRYLMYTRIERGQPNRLYVYDIAKRSAREVARGTDLEGLSDHGHTDGVREFSYAVPTPNGTEVHSVAAEGLDRLIARLAPGSRVLGIRGDTLAYTVQSGDSTTVFVIRGAQSSPRRLLTFPGRRASLEASAWSPDGRTLAVITYSGTGQRPVYRVMLADIDERGGTAAPRYVAVEEGWGLRWLSDGSAVVFIGMDSTGTVTNVWRVPRTGTSAVSITRSVHDPFWGYAISPDGNMVALPVEHIAGSVAWRIDLDAAAAAYRAGKRNAGRP